ncbi:ISL3 family transposase [Nonomuraea sp. K274]|uniref:ISL3 family transposase n=1 Tax=Nonomuraea cypriaca TaxID=1187855 RepID=A0A931F006_9ACTN|nr:transposase [Nonomuraea cypriaca]MBF8185783.1 ISL3 family transposase [Nonomuraea cypriaca]
MDQHIANLLLGLDGVDVFDAATSANGTLTVYVTTSPDIAGGCTGCGVLSRRPLELVATHPRDLAVGERRVRLVWHKRRWWCDENACQKRTFSEAIPQINPGMRTTRRLRRAIGEAIGEQLLAAAEAARSHGVAWPTAHACFVELADDAGIIPALDPCPGPIEPAEPDSQAARGGQLHDDGLPPVAHLGIDDTRRGKRRLRKDPVTGTWTVLADRWQTGFVDINGEDGLLGQVQGRAAADAISWLKRQPKGWLAAVEIVAIDMSASYKAAIRTVLPHAAIAVDRFHVVQLANKMVATVRRKETARKYGRRGRDGDPEYAVKRLLMRNFEDLSGDARAKMWKLLADAGPAGEAIKAAYVAKELIREVLALSPSRTGVTPAHSQIRHRLYTFFTWCAIFDDIPELATFVNTIDKWSAELIVAVRTGVSNAKSEGVNRIVKLVARVSYGFRNVTNQHRRVRYAATRAGRRAKSQTATVKRSVPVAA